MVPGGQEWRQAQALGRVGSFSLEWRGRRGGLNRTPGRNDNFPKKKKNSLTHMYNNGTI